MTEPLPIVTTIGIPVAKRHIFLCAEQTKPKCCDYERGVAAWDFLKKRLKELGLSEQGGVLRSKANCLRICEAGPGGGGLSGRRLVPGVRSAGARADHPGAPDRRPRGRGPAAGRAPARTESGLIVGSRSKETASGLRLLDPLLHQRRPVRRHLVQQRRRAFRRPAASRSAPARTKPSCIGVRHERQQPVEVAARRSAARTACGAAPAAPTSAPRTALPRYPSPPGSAMKPSDNSAISALRSCIEPRHAAR